MVIAEIMLSYIIKMNWFEEESNEYLFCEYFLVKILKKK